MKGITQVFSLIVAIVLPVEVANASTMTFNYTFSDSSILQGTLDGTVQGDSDTVFINSFGAVNYFGTDFSSIELTDFVSVSDFPLGALQPLVSISGNLMDVFVCPNGFSSGNCGFAIESGFFFNNGSVGVGDGLGNTVFENFDAANWNLNASTSPVPAPAAVWLFGSGLMGLLGVRKKAKLSAQLA